MELEVKIFGVNFLFDTTSHCIDIGLHNAIDIVINGKFYKNANLLNLFAIIQKYFSKKYSESEIMAEINRVFCIPSRGIDDPIQGFLTKLGYY